MTPTLITRAVIRALLVSLFGLAALNGQVNTATLAGTVTDRSGAAVPGAAVVARNLATNVEHNAITGEEGIYVLPNLPAGRYSVTVRKQGFRTLTQSGIGLAVDQRARVDIQLPLGEVAESINVVGNVEQVDTESSTVGQVIGNKRVVELPLNGRNFAQLTALSPGTLVQGSSQYTSAPSVLGQRKSGRLHRLSVRRSRELRTECPDRANQPVH